MRGQEGDDRCVQLQKLGRAGKREGGFVPLQTGVRTAWESGRQDVCALKQEAPEQGDAEPCAHRKKKKYGGYCVLFVFDRRTAGSGPFCACGSREALFCPPPRHEASWCICGRRGFRSDTASMRVPAAAPILAQVMPAGQADHVSFAVPVSCFSLYCDLAEKNSSESRNRGVSLWTACFANATISCWVQWLVSLQTSSG